MPAAAIAEHAEDRHGLDDDDAVKEIPQPERRGEAVLLRSRTHNSLSRWLITWV